MEPAAAARVGVAQPSRPLSRGAEDPADHRVRGMGLVSVGAQDASFSLKRCSAPRWAERATGALVCQDARARDCVQPIVIWVRRIIERRPWRLCRVSV